MSSVNNNLLYFSQTQGYYYFLPLGTQFLRVKYQRLTTMYMHLLLFYYYYYYLICYYCYLLQKSHTK